MKTLPSMLAIKIDSSRGIVWTTEVALKAFANISPKDAGHTEIAVGWQYR